MADEVLRLRVHKALTAILERIDRRPFGIEFQAPVLDHEGTVLGDDNFFKGRVKRGRIIFGEGDPLPMLSILEVPIPLDQEPAGTESPYSRGTWELLIQGFATDDPDNPTDPAHILMAAAKKELALARRANRDYKLLGLGDHVTDMRVGAGVVRPPDDISAKAYFWLNVSLDLVEDLSDPFED